MSLSLGFYKWTYAGGEFLVSFRPNGVFHCAKFPASATWAINGNQLIVDWKKYGIYEFNFSGNPTSWAGYARGAPANWRKIDFVRDFNVSERALIGNGFGSVWDFGWEKGSFEVEFRIDGYNHFVCKQYPAHSHWDIDETELITINWGNYGVYELRASANGELQGHAKGQPSNWRRARFLRSLGPETMGDQSHDHSHEDHVHTSSCGH